MHPWRDSTWQRKTAAATGHARTEGSCIVPTLHLAAENHVSETELQQKLRKAAVGNHAGHAHQPDAPAAPVAALPRAKGVLRRTDMLGMQRSVGNRTAAENVRERGATGLVSRKPGAPLLIQRASFSELMAFWKKQELGQETQVPTGPKAKGAP